MNRNGSERSRDKKSVKPEKTTAGKSMSKAKNDAVEEEEEDVTVSETSSSESEPEEEKASESESEEENASESEKSEDSDDECIRILFEEKAASRNLEKVWGKIPAKFLKRGGSSSSNNEQEVEKKKRKGTMEAAIEEDRRRRKEEKKKKKKEVVVEDEDEDEEERKKREGSVCKFPMNRIHRIMKDHQNCSSKIAQEAIFLVNKASEKFLELYCREAYACAYLDHKNHISYGHLASVVSKRKRFDFLSDIVPQKVKAEDALAEMSVTDKWTGNNPGKF